MFFWNSFKSLFSDPVCRCLLWFSHDIYSAYYFFLNSIVYTIIFTPEASDMFPGSSIHTEITAYQNIFDVECTDIRSRIWTNGVSLWAGLPSMTKQIWKPNDNKMSCFFFLSLCDVLGMGMYYKTNCAINIYCYLLKNE